MFEMVTYNAAKALWMSDRIGTLTEGKLGDILVLKKNHDDPYENLVNASMDDIELLVLAGFPIYGEMRFIDIHGGELPSGFSQIEVGGQNAKNRPMFVKGDPAGLYAGIRQKIGFKKVLDFMPIDPEPDLRHQNTEKD